MVAAQNKKLSVYYGGSLLRVKTGLLGGVLVLVVFLGCAITQERPEPVSPVEGPEKSDVRLREYQLPLPLPQGHGGGGAPEMMLGSFQDDYQINYTISDETWSLDPQFKFHVLKWNHWQEFLIAQNDVGNPSEAGLWSRIDWIELDNPDWPWAFCLTVYDADSPEAAEAAKGPDRFNPKTGCNGFPFSRMRPVHKTEMKSAP